MNRHAEVVRKLKLGHLVFDRTQPEAIGEDALAKFSLLRHTLSLGSHKIMDEEQNFLKEGTR